MVKEVIDFSETTLTVYGDSLNEALEKIEILGVGTFMGIDDFKEKLILKDVLEMEEDLEWDEDEIENIEEKKE